MIHHQRFLLAVFLFISFQLIVQTKEIRYYETEVEALNRFKISITNDPSGALKEWTNAIHYCNWSGITCDSSNHVINITLVESNLQGSVSPFIGNLTSLQVFDLTSNSFSGNIPNQLQKCSNLTELVLYNNSFSGEIPAEFGRLKALQTLDFGNNFFNGSIPDSICNCTALEQDDYPNVVYEVNEGEYEAYSPVIPTSIRNRTIESSVVAKVGAYPDYVLKSVVNERTRLRGQLHEAKKETRSTVAQCEEKLFASSEKIMEYKGEVQDQVRLAELWEAKYYELQTKYQQNIISTNQDAGGGSCSASTVNMDFLFP